MPFDGVQFYQGCAGASYEEMAEHEELNTDTATAIAQWYERHPEAEKPQRTDSQQLLEKIRAACPGATANFLVLTQEQEWDAATAAKHWAVQQAAQITEQARTIANLQAEVTSLKVSQAESRFSSDETAGPTPADNFRDAVSAAAAGGKTRAQAVGEVMRTNPTLYRDFLEYSRRGRR